MNANKPNYYAIIPANIRYDEKLSPNEKLFYGEITALTNKEGYCWANNAYFARLYAVEKRTIRRWLNKLKELNYIKIEIEYVPRKRQIDKRKIWIINQCISLPTPGQFCPHP